MKLYGVAIAMVGKESDKATLCCTTVEIDSKNRKDIKRIEGHTFDKTIDFRSESDVKELIIKVADAMSAASLLQGESYFHDEDLEETPPLSVVMGEDSRYKKNYTILLETLSNLDLNEIEEKAAQRLVITLSNSWVNKCGYNVVEGREVNKEIDNPPETERHYQIMDILRKLALENNKPALKALMRNVEILATMRALTHIADVTRDNYVERFGEKEFNSASGVISYTHPSWETEWVSSIPEKDLDTREGRYESPHDMITSWNKALDEYYDLVLESSLNTTANVYIDRPYNPPKRL